jgi:uncharacterized membrane protein (UPF0182 family)
MSDFFAENAESNEPAPARSGRGSRPRPLILTLVVMALFLIGFSIFANIWTDKLWFSSLGRSDVFNTLLWTKVGLFAVFGVLMALIVGGNLWTAYRLRPAFRANTPDQANLERYREQPGLRDLRRRHRDRSVADLAALGKQPVVREDRPVLP